MNKLSNNIFIGAATAAHQVEGNNIHSDSWIMENIPRSLYKEPSGDACDHYNRYEEDIKMLSDAGYNAYRFSIEWARIEPEKGKFIEEEIEHYRGMLNCCIKYGITPIVTLHHFTSPAWTMIEGGWEAEKMVTNFSNYVEYVIGKLGDLIPYVCTINEANMGLQITKIIAEMKQQHQNQGNDIQVGLNMHGDLDIHQYYMKLAEAFQVSNPMDIQTFLSPRTLEGDKIIMKCHMKAREVIRKISPSTKVGSTFSLMDYQPLPGCEEYVKKEWEEDFLHYLYAIEDDDFIGLQNYTRKVIGEKGAVKNDAARFTQAGYEYYPEALAGVARYVSKYFKKSIIVTENGLATSDDKERVEFIGRALIELQQCIREGIKIEGYLHWSLLDNFEWMQGYSQTFGLVAVDRNTQERHPKDSFFYLGDIAKTRVIK